MRANGSIAERELRPDDYSTALAFRVSRPGTALTQLRVCLRVRPAANGQLDHPSRIFLVDAQGRVREIYNLTFLKPQWVSEDMRLLLDEGQPGEGHHR